MKLQNILFPSTDTCTEEPMYFRRGDKVFYNWSSDGVEIQKDGILFFDTYFNGFTIEKWAKYTNVKTVSLTVRIEGHVRLTLMRKEKKGNQILTDFLGEYICKANYGEIKEFTFPFHSVSTNGIYCFSITGLSEQSGFYGGFYSGDIAEKDIQPVKIAIDICTYKRERFIEKNLKLLNDRFLENPDSFLHGKLEVFVSDNAHTLDVPALSSENIHIVQNKNVGGAGGFTRGMIEINRVKQQRHITHILVMDDDITIEPESLFRTCTFLSCRKAQYQDLFIGAATGYPVHSDRSRCSLERRRTDFPEAWLGFAGTGCLPVQRTGRKNTVQCLVVLRFPIRGCNRSEFADADFHPWR